MPLIQRKMASRTAASFLIPACILYFLLKISLTPTVPSSTKISQKNVDKLIAASENTIDPIKRALIECNIPPMKDDKDFHNYMNENHFPCTDFKYFGMGVNGDGRKGVCLDEEFRPVPGQCHVLSFGINKDRSFDDDMGAYGCQVYSFDPTIKLLDHKHAENVTFFNLGVSDKNGRERVGTVDTYKGILDRLGLTNSIIAYLKMDIELAEIRVLNDIFNNYPHLMKNVKQFGLEAHYAWQREVFWYIFHKLECLGFRFISARHFGGRSEIVWLQVEDEILTSLIH